MFWFWVHEQILSLPHITVLLLSIRVSEGFSIVFPYFLQLLGREHSAVTKMRGGGWLASHAAQAPATYGRRRSLPDAPGVPAEGRADRLPQGKAATALPAALCHRLPLLDAAVKADSGARRHLCSSPRPSGPSPRKPARLLLLLLHGVGPGLQIARAPRSLNHHPLTGVH